VQLPDGTLPALRCDPLQTVFDAKVDGQTETAQVLA
jgi:hypothetical protein